MIVSKIRFQMQSGTGITIYCARSMLSVRPEGEATISQWQIPIRGAGWIIQVRQLGFIRSNACTLYRLGDVCPHHVPQAVRPTIETIRTRVHDPDWLWLLQHIAAFFSK